MENPPKEVLVVEDEPLVRIAAADALVDRGIIAREAGDASEALHALDKHPQIGVLFTDINMPGDPDGLGLAKKVSIDRPDLEIIVTSGAKRLSDEDLPDDGVFLAKPYSPERLVQMVEQKLQKDPGKDGGSP
jgi:DNA-binding NtrC family response regulator